jgi:hypothetical protein
LKIARNNNLSESEALVALRIAQDDNLMNQVDSLTDGAIGATLLETDRGTIAEIELALESDLNTLANRAINDSSLGNYKGQDFFDVDKVSIPTLNCFTPLPS